MKIILVLICLLRSFYLFGLPISFGINQGDLEYYELSSKNFRVYHDKRTPNEAKLLVETLESIKPIAESWFEIKQGGRLPIISSAVTDGPSFANFLLDTIELQTMGQGDRDLFLHEYTHTMMYRHFHNLLGPAGALIHLPWIPAWLVEGLAECLSISVGSDAQASIERFYALKGNWPSYDRLASLYGRSDDNFSHRGYALSGSFVTWLFRLNPDFSLAQLLNDIYQYSMPWYYPLSFNPFISYYPTEKALMNQFNKSAQELYEQYKNEATAYWKSQSNGIFWSNEKDKKINLSGFNGLVSRGSESYIFLDKGSHRVASRLLFSRDSGWLNDLESQRFEVPERIYWHRLAFDGNDIIAAKVEQDEESLLYYHKLVLLKKIKGGKYTTDNNFFRFNGFVLKMFSDETKIFWLEQEQEITKFCQLDKNLLRNNITINESHIECFFDEKTPNSLKYLGHVGNSRSSKKSFRENLNKIWFAKKEQTSHNDRYKIFSWQTKENQTFSLNYQLGGSPIKILEKKENLWLLVGSQERRNLVKLDKNGNCLGLWNSDDFITDIYSSGSDKLIFVLFNGKNKIIKRVSEDRLNLKPCQNLSQHTTPYMVALNNKNDLTLSDALLKSSYWKTSNKDLAINVSSLNKSQAKERSVKKESKRHFIKDSKHKNFFITQSSSKSKWRGRPALIFPWVGGDDIFGMQYGALTLPLIDEMQNEELRLTMLYGVESKYPSFSLSLISRRYTPTYSLVFSKRQKWNGVYYDKDEKTLSSSYLDEINLDIAMSIRRVYRYLQIFFRPGLSVSETKPFYGSDKVLFGFSIQPFFLSSFKYRYGKWLFSLNLNYQGAPALLNEKFHYNSLGGRLSVGRSFSFLRSNVSLGIKASRTRGKTGKSPNLKEFYIPLRTFIPGSGGGINQTSYSLTQGGSLFLVRYGDTQFKSFINLNFPVLDNINRLFWILYMKDLEFSAFVNYGSIWNQNSSKSLKFLLAHGYNLDLSLENKGVNFNLGFGSGQLVSDVWQFYIKFGFDALF
ncbi:MAG: hypothetical protein CMP11_06765 [Zetaproteobacteria bacterium]|nr:hypothetical protein [Pseudobdellovibrionaceae bacterium]